MDYLIDVPPPTISGTLHAGHIFSYAQMDFIARYQKLSGKQLIYPFCFDNNGLPTQKLGRDAGKKTQEEIVAHSLDMSGQYLDLFNKIHMGYCSLGYNSMSDFSAAMAELSFNDLKAKNLVYKGEAEYMYCPKTCTSVAMSEVDENGIYERSGVKVEIRKGEGWFIRVVDHIKDIRDAINQINWQPAFFKERLLDWLDQVKFDWSISREREYGLRMEADPQYVYDTWFTSSLSPQLSYSSQSGIPDLNCPVFDLRCQGHDIIRTWALFTIIKSLYHNNKIPWRTILMSGHALDKNGKKISKTAGNYVPPQRYIDQYGGDGVRYWAAHSQPGADTRIDEQLMLKGKKLTNKLRNAKRFIDQKPLEGFDYDMWLIWEQKNKEIHELMNRNEYADSIEKLTSFFWGVFCDIWIESSKTTPCGKLLHSVFSEMLPLFGCFMPQIEIELLFDKDKK